MSSEEDIEILNLGLTPYKEAIDKMESLHHQIASKSDTKEVIILTEHLTTITLGKRNLKEDVLYSKESLRKMGIAYVQTYRGGSATIHEPGQVVIYPLLRLLERKLSVRDYVGLLEESIIKECEKFHIQANRDAINPGVWVGKNKIDAIGIRIQNRVSKHGLAFNINNNLNAFSTIVPCGLKTRGVTSLKKETKLDSINHMATGMSLCKYLSKMIIKKNKTGHAS